MAVWVVLLVVTNGLTLTALAVLWRRGHGLGPSEDVFTAPRPGGVTTRSRRLITIEVLNPIELVSTRGRVAGLAGSLVPGLARRVVYDQVLKTLRRELADKQVVADVQLHHLRPVAIDTPAIDTPAIGTPGFEAPPTEVDDVVPLDLEAVADDQL